MTKTITVQGLTFAVTSPYSAGHVVNEIEAAVLNQTRYENLRNNFAPKIKKAMEGLAEGQTLAPDKLAALQAEFAECDATYNFAMPGGGGTRGPVDPIGDAAWDLARLDVVARARAKNMKLTKAKVDEYTDRHYESKKDHYRAKAEKAMAQAAKTAQAGDEDDMFAALPPKATEAPAATA